MKQGIFEIIENSPLRADVMRLRLRGDCSAIENNIALFSSLDTVKVVLDVLEESTINISTIDA